LLCELRVDGEPVRRRRRHAATADHDGPEIAIALRADALAFGRDSVGPDPDQVQRRMTTTGKVIVLAAVIGGGLVAGRLIRRVRRSACFSDAANRHVAVFSAAGELVRCENELGQVVSLELCRGAEPCRDDDSPEAG
jgi:hypothetical protein